MRLLIVTSFMILLFGCHLTKPLAPLLEMPKVPQLNYQKFQIEYIKTEQEKLSSLQIKSVQLPAHQITKKQTIAFDLSKAEVSYDLARIFNEQFKKINLKPVSDTINTEYKLTLNKITHKIGAQVHFELKNKSRMKGIVDNKLIAKMCDSMDTIISLRLTHTKSGDVVWFAQSEINSSNYPTTPLSFKFNFYEIINNKKQISLFITNHNTEEARIIRAQTPVSIPSYIISTHSSDLVKVSGVCSQTEANDLAEKISQYLIKNLVNKLKISDIYM